MYEASIVGSDRLTDIGVVKIENDNLTLSILEIVKEFLLGI